MDGDIGTIYRIIFKTDNVARLIYILREWDRNDKEPLNDLLCSGSYTLATANVYLK